MARRLKPWVERTVAPFEFTGSAPAAPLWSRLPGLETELLAHERHAIFCLASLFMCQRGRAPEHFAADASFRVRNLMEGVLPGRNIPVPLRLRLSRGTRRAATCRRVCEYQKALLVTLCAQLWAYSHRNAPLQGARLDASREGMGLKETRPFYAHHSN